MSVCHLCDDYNDGLRDRDNTIQKLRVRVRKLLEEVEALKKEKKAAVKAQIIKRAELHRKIKLNTADVNKTTLQRVKEKLKERGCCLCGYNKTPQAVDFHHIKTKSATIAQIHSIEHFIDEIRLNPVVLLCANCHRELHAGAIRPQLDGREVKI